MSTPPPTEAAPRTYSWVAFVWLLAVAVAGTTALGFLGSLWWRLELLSHFRVQYLLIALAPLLVFAILRRWRGVAFAAAIAAVNLGCILPLYASAGADEPSPKPLRLLIANVHSRNTNYSAFLDLVTRESPDLVLVMELDPGWSEVLEDLRDRYPHSLTRVRSDNFGIGLWSRRPLTRAAILDDVGPVPSIEAELVADGAPVHLLLTHPVPPVRRDSSAVRDEQLRRIAQLARARGPRTVVAGDFNTTPWSPIFAEVLELGGLQHPGAGIYPTWPAWLPWPLRIPIDHCLVAGGARVVAQRLGPANGSDHRPLIVDLAF